MGKPTGRPRGRPKKEVVVQEEDFGEEPRNPSLLVGIGEDAVNPLILIGEDNLAELSDIQQKFLLARMVLHSDAAASRAAEVTPAKVKGWKEESSHFQGAYALITADPISFALSLNRFIVAKAAVEHMGMLMHPNARIRQWAIELAYKVQNMGTEKNIKVTGDVNHKFDELRQLARETPVALPEPPKEEDVIEGTFIELNGGRTTERTRRVDSVLDRPDLLPDDIREDSRPGELRGVPVPPLGLSETVIEDLAGE